MWRINMCIHITYTFSNYNILPPLVSIYTVLSVTVLEWAVCSLIYHPYLLLPSVCLMMPLCRLDDFLLSHACCDEKIFTQMI